MPAATCFIFDCPACGVRLRMDAGQRGHVLTCDACQTAFPGPDFLRSFWDPPPQSCDEEYTCRCPRCRRALTAREHARGRTIECAACGGQFIQPPPPWDEWRRRVARVITHYEQRWSLSHLLFVCERTFVPDEKLPAGWRRRFEFYCGQCGRLQRARVWDIAAQKRCTGCDALLIVPAPRAPRRPGRMVASYSAGREMAASCAARVRAGGYLQSAREAAFKVAREAALTVAQEAAQPKRLYCPQCGRPVEPADPTRRRTSHCARCALWF